MAYVDLYFHIWVRERTCRVGRYISLPDIEAQLAPNNYTYTHSLTYTYDCYTQTGINMTTKVEQSLDDSSRILWRMRGRSLGARCQAHRQCLCGYNWSEGGDNVYICVNSINNGKYNYNNLAAYYTTWYHKFGNPNGTWPGRLGINI